MLLFPLLLALSIGLTQGLPADTPDRPTTPDGPATDPSDDSAGSATAILTSRCAGCHGPDGDGGLDVTSRAGLLGGGDLGPSIVPGDPDASLILGAVRHSHATLRMPKRRPRMPEAEIEVLARWIGAGAPWPSEEDDATEGAAVTASVSDTERSFWSFRPLVEPPVPDVDDTAWPRRELDRFVLARLDREGLTPAAQADRRTIVRRLSLDLTGLPPTPEATKQFLDDDAPHAYDRLVERLLASPAYGEHRARWWLDVARYADDDCRSLDPKGRGYADYPNAHRYRDWVVDALNADRPYDDFVRAQLAADHLDGYSRKGDLPALGFLGLGPWQYENASLAVTRAEERDERVDAVTRGLLGLTVSCARCHDHKFDPISTEDYHALAGVFLNTEYHQYPLASAARVAEYDRERARLDGLKEILREMRREASRRLAATYAVDAERYLLAAWRVLGESGVEPHRICREEKLDRELFDRFVLFLGRPRVRYGFLEDWDALVARGGTRDEARAWASSFQRLVVDVMLEKRAADRENEIIRAQAQTGTKPRKRANLPNEFQTQDDICPGCDLEFVAPDAERMALWTDLFDHDLTQPFDPGDADGGWRSGLFAFYGHDLERRLSGGGREAIERLRARVAELEKELPEPYAFAHGVIDVAEPRDLRIHERGDPLRLGAEVPRRFLAVLCPKEPTPWTVGSGRRELAEAIAKHPLSDRVIVNRTWQAFFGRGLVASASNFGRSGDAPSHPELLEHLAWRFRSEGRSLKDLQRTIVTSATYRQSVDADETSQAADPDNRLLSHASRRRLTAEQLRDAILAASGALDRSVGGPPERLTATSTRRTLYAHVSRYSLHEYLRLFDFPSPGVTSPGRFTTDVPAQRLFLSNSEFVARNAERIARRVAVEPDEVARIERLYELLHGRPPKPDEIESALAYVTSEPLMSYRERLAATVVDPAPGEGPEEEAEEGPTEVAFQRSAWGRLAAALIGTDEFLFID